MNTQQRAVRGFGPTWVVAGGYHYADNLMGSVGYALAAQYVYIPGGAIGESELPWPTPRYPDYEL